MSEYAFKCESFVIVNVDGVDRNMGRCGFRFVDYDKDAVCPKCGGRDLRIIPNAFLKLWDMNEDIKHYVTEEMEVRKGLDSEAVEIARQIINKYSGEVALTYEI